MERTCIVVLGARVRPDGSPGDALRRRVETAIGLARTAPEARIIVSGGRANARRPSEAAVMAQFMIEAGIEPGRIIQEDRSRDTLENARFCVPILAREGPFDRVVLVTSGLHMPRSRALFRALGVRVEPVRAQASGGRLGLATVLAIVLHEAVALPWDLLLAVTGAPNIGRR